MSNHPTSGSSEEEILNKKTSPSVADKAASSAAENSDDEAPTASVEANEPALDEAIGEGIKQNAEESAPLEDATTETDTVSSQDPDHVGQMLDGATESDHTASELPEQGADFGVDSVAPETTEQSLQDSAAVSTAHAAEPADESADGDLDTAPKTSANIEVTATASETTEPASATLVEELPDTAESAGETLAEAATDAADGEAAVELDRFEDYVLPEPLLQAIRELGFEHCTPIQSRTLPYSLADYDVTGQAQTGTGKTAAFLISMLTRFWEFPLQEALPNGTPRALILAPTRELALQIEDDAQKLSKHMDMHTVCVVGGMDFNKQREKLNRRPVDLLVATPGRLIDFIERREIRLDKTEVLVIDEADRMLDMGFIPDVRRIVYQTPHKRKRQTLFFSATFNDEVMRLASSWTIDPAHIVIEPESVATDTVDQKFWSVAAAERKQLLVKLIRQENPERAIVFANRRDQTHRLVEYLRKHDVQCEGLAGDIPQNKRLATLNRFKQGKLHCLIATDVAGRGIHVDGVSHVVNFELPEDPEDYVHRIGRTGRAGASGRSISFISEDDGFNLPALEEYLGEPIKCTQPDLTDAAPNAK